MNDAFIGICDGALTPDQCAHILAARRNSCTGAAKSRRARAA
jgi:hypothetical protein